MSETHHIIFKGSLTLPAWARKLALLSNIVPHHILSNTYRLITYSLGVQLASPSSIIHITTSSNLQVTVLSFNKYKKHVFSSHFLFSCIIFTIWIKATLNMRNMEHYRTELILCTIWIIYKLMQKIIVSLDLNTE